MFKKIFFAVLTLSLVLAACAPAAAPVEDVMMDKPTEAMMDKPADDMMTEEPHDNSMSDSSSSGAMAEDAMSDKSDDMMMVETPAWFDATLTDAATGQEFSINSFKGKVVLVETLAMWCSNCKKQQGQVKDLHALLGERDDFVSVGLDIDPNENLETLATYVANNGFDWTYGVATTEVAREIGQLYGDQFLNPPSTPMLIIDRKGQAHPLPFGIKSAEDLYNALLPYLNEG